MIGIFKQKNPANLLLLLLFGVLIKLPIFLHPHVVNSSEVDNILYKDLIKFLGSFRSSFPAIYSLTAFILLFLQPIVITRIINNNRMVSVAGYLPGMAYMLITSLFPQWNHLSAVLVVNTIFLFILSGLLKIYNQQNVNGIIYNIGLASGISLFIFTPSMTFIIWVFLGLMIMRPFRINECLLCIIGITTPFYFYAIYLVIASQWSWQSILPDLSFNLIKVKQSTWFAGCAFLLAAPFLIGSYYVQNRLRRMLIQVRKGWSLLLLYLIAAIFVPFFSKGDTFENWVMCAIPFAAFHSCMYLYSPKRIFSLLVFWITVAFVLGYQYYGPGW